MGFLRKLFKFCVGQGLGRAGSLERGVRGTWYDSSVLGNETGFGTRRPWVQCCSVIFAGRVDPSPPIMFLDGFKLEGVVSEVCVEGLHGAQ